ncbi:hypothetical protein EBZ37_09030, partial [bacterium]|nr:hypothetical protein [bacterium]
MNCGGGEVVMSRSNQRFRKMILVGVAALGVWSAVKIFREPGAPSPWEPKGRMVAGGREVPLGHGDPWYGGKPSLSVRVSSTVQGAIPAGEWIPIQLKIQSDTDCSSITSKVRGVDALEVLASDQTQACQSGVLLSHEARVRILPDGAGVLAVDIEVQTPDGPRQVTR